VLPVTVVGGYLGAGKTTLVNHLLREARGLRLAVLVNDFGDLSIDADLIEAREGDLIRLAGGCVCCSVGSDLMAALLRLGAMAPPPDALVIETSGVALPGAVARTVGLAPGLALDAIVVMADAETVRARAGDRYVGDTVRTQLAEADLVLVNKADLLAADEVTALRAWIAELAPRARVIDCVRAGVPAGLVLGAVVERDAALWQDAAVGRNATVGRDAALGFSPARHQATHLFHTASFRFDESVDARALGAALAQPPLGLARAKGILRGPDGTRVLLQVVGSRVDVSPFDRPASGDGRLVCIGARGSLDAAALARAVERFGGVPLA